MIVHENPDSPTDYKHAYKKNKNEDILKVVDLELCANY